MSILFPSGVRFLSRAAALTVSYHHNRGFTGSLSRARMPKTHFEHGAMVHTRRTAPRLQYPTRIPARQVSVSRRRRARRRRLRFVGVVYSGAIDDAQLFGTAARYRRLSDSKTAFGDEGATRPPPMLLGY
jgi:hypothetical protein